MLSLYDIGEVTEGEMPGKGGKRSVPTGSRPKGGAGGWKKTQCEKRTGVRARGVHTGRSREKSGHRTQGGGLGDRLKDGNGERRRGFAGGGGRLGS